MKYLQYIIGLAILAVILFRIDLGHLLAVLSGINVPLLIAISLITIPQLFLKSLRWHYLLKMQNIEYSIFKSFVTYAKGIYFGIITPGRLGELIKVVYLRNEKSVEVGEGFSSVLLDRFFDVYMLIIVSAMSCLKFSVTQPVVWLFIIGILIFIPFILVVFKVEKVRRIFKKPFDFLFPAGRNSFLRGHIESFYYGFRKIPTKGILLSFMLTVGIYTMFFVQCYFLSRLVNLNLGFVNVIFISSIASLVAVIPVSALGIGTRDATIVYFFGKIGIAAAKGIAYSFLMFFSFYIIGAIIGFLSWNIKFSANGKPAFAGKKAEPENL